MPSRRLPHQSQLNAWSSLLAERRAAGARLVDLTESNPTRVGLGGAAEPELRALAGPAGARYAPDPRGTALARAAVNRYYASRGLEVDSQNIVLTASTSEAYAHLLRLLGDPGDAFLAPAPSYPLFEPLASLEGVKLAHYRLAYDGRWHLDLDSLEQAARSGGRAVIVVQPNNPTGSCLSEAEVAAVESLCERQGMAIVSDEVFGDFRWPPDPVPLPSLLGSRRVPTFVLGGLSKLCGMPQMKLAWIAAAGPAAGRDEALGGLEWIADLFLSVSTPVQGALPVLLEARHGFQARWRERVAANLTSLRALVARRPELTLLEAEGGWGAVLRVPEVRSDEDWALELLRRGVVAHPGHFYDFAAGAHLVLSLIVAPAVFTAGLEQIEALSTEG